MFHKRLIKEFKENRKMIAGMVASQWVMLIANVLFMLSVSHIVASLLQGKTNELQIVHLVTMLLVVLLVRGIMSYVNQKLSVETSSQLKDKLRSMIYEKLMRLGSDYKDTVKTSEAVQISTEGVEQLEIYFGKYMPQFFYSLLAPLTLFVIVGTMNLKVAIVLLLCVPLIPISIVAVQKFAKKMLAKYWGTYTELGDSFLESLQGLTTLKIYQADERYAKKMDDESEKFRKVTMRVLIMQLNSISIMDLVAYGGAAIGIILSLVELQRGNIDLAQCFFIIMISAEFFLPLRLLGSFFHIAMNGNAAADKIFRLLDEEESKPAKLTKLSAIHSQQIRFEQVSFGYEENQTVLEDISFLAKTGLTAFVGESGCGKSTIVSLIMGENQVGQGKILIGNEAITDIEKSVLYKKVTRIRHDSFLFAGTVRENLCMGKADATDMEMYAALKKVNMDDYVRQNGGLDLHLQERAANLSGGQKQRLSIARAILHDTDIYIFDEATSNVDVESENDIMAVVTELAKEKTVFLISHRLANVVLADQIYVLKDGKVVEEGIHSDLIGAGGYYNTLYNEQKKLEQYVREV